VCGRVGAVPVSALPVEDQDRLQDFRGKGRGKGKGGVKKKKKNNNNNSNNNNKLSGRTKHHVTRVESRLSRLGTWHRISTWGGCSKFDQKSFRCSA